MLAADRARIDGFVIQGGKVRGQGAGILCDRASSTISNNTIVHNATLQPEGLAERKMIHQHANEGGGIACINGSNGTITNNVIARNTTEIGGGAGIGVNNMSLPQITHNVICDNHAGIADVDRSRCNNGGGISASQASPRLPLRMTIANNVIVNNRCGGNSDGGGIYLEYDSSPLVAANWILGNLAEDDGGGMYIMKLSHPDVIGNIVAGSKGSSGITLSKGGRGNFENNFIYANFYGITCPESWMLLRHNTIVANHGPGVAYRQAKHWKPAVVTENIIYGNAGAVQIEGGSEYPLIVTGNDIQGGHAGEGNFDEPISFGNDRLTGTANSVTYDARRTHTTLTTVEIGGGERVVGRAIRLGDKWGLVKSFANGRIVVWGDLRTPNPETRFEIPMSYVLRSAAPRGVGARMGKTVTVGPSGHVTLEGNRMNRRFVQAILACALSVGLGAVVSSAEEQPQVPRPRMEPAKLGPRTEQVDAKDYAKALHVAPSGSDQGDGSRARPLASVAQAVANIKDATAENRYAILVAAGAYNDGTILMKPYVDLFGGFDAKSWQRGHCANRERLDGAGQRRVAVGADNARIDGFVICNGRVRGHGAGILCGHASPTISNNTFLRNATQEPEGATTKLYHQQGNDGGAIACVTGSNATVNNNLIAGNTTEIGCGAGIAVANWSMPHILNNVICDNVTGLTDVQNSRSSNGAGISANNALLRPPLRMTVTNNVVANNRANGNSDAGGIYCEYDSAPLIGANWILGNWAQDDGSAVYFMKSSHPLFTSNIVAGHGNHGAIRLSKEGRADIEHNLIYANVNALSCISSWMNLKNNTIVDNGAGVGMENSYAPHLRPPVITANLIYGNQGGQLGANTTNAYVPVVANNDIQGGYQGGEGNFDTKPEFENDGAEGPIQSMGYDEQQVVTTISVAEVPGGGKLAGRVVKVGDKWSVVKGSGNGKIVAWGDLRSKEPATAFRIAPTYQLRTALAGDVGAQTKH